MPLSIAGEIYAMGVTNDLDPASVDASFEIVDGILDSGTTVLSTTGNIQSIDFDDINRVLYWSENAFGAGDEFAIKTYDGTTESSIVISPLPGDENITGIALHPAAGKIFWVIGNQLFCSDLNGSGQEVIVTTTFPLHKVAIDKINNRVFVVGIDATPEMFMASYDLDGGNELFHILNLGGFSVVSDIAISPNLDLFYILTTRDGATESEVRTRGIGAGPATLLVDMPVLDTYPIGGQSITIEDTLNKLYVASGITGTPSTNAIFKQDLDGGNKEEFTNLPLVYKGLAIIPCLTCEVTHVLVPTSTTTSLNFFATPNQGSTELHLNIDAVGVCGLVEETDRLTGNEDISRVKVGFTPPPLNGTRTFYGIIGNICGAFTGTDTETGNIGAELFIEGIPLKKLLFIFPAPALNPTGTVGGYSWYDPNFIGDLAFHEALTTAGLNPATVNWSTLEVQITIDTTMASGVSFELNWLAITLFEKAIDPIALGGVVGGGVASEEVNIFIEGNVKLGGIALVSGPVVEEGLGGIVVSPTSLVVSTETKPVSGGAIVPATVVFVDFVKHFAEFPTDTICFLSGGSTNGDPLLSIGGEISFVEAEGNLFDDFQPEESTTGLEDYRCIYIFNNTVSTITNLKIWKENSPLSSGAIALGLFETNDIQEVNLSFLSGSGSFTLDFGGIDVVVNAAATLDIFALNFQNALRNNTSLTDVIVQAQLLGTTVSFITSFIGDDGNKNHPTFALVNNGLTGNPAISIAKTNIGSPVNAIATSIATDTTVPVATFRETTQILPIVVPTLNKDEGFPLWIRRTIASNPVATQDDGFFLKIFSNTIVIA